MISDIIPEITTKWKKEIISAFYRPEKTDYIEFMKDGKLHNIEFLARLIYYPSNNTICEIHYAVDVKIHRVGYPATIKFDRNNKIISKGYWVNHKLHRHYLEGPAYTEIYKDLHYEEYWFEGKRHRPIEEGPACVVYSPHYEGEYWVNGEKITVN